MIEPEDPQVTLIVSTRFSRDVEEYSLADLRIKGGPSFRKTVCAGFLEPHRRIAILIWKTSSFWKGLRTHQRSELGEMLREIRQLLVLMPISVLV